MYPSHNEMIKQLRALARERGLVFKTKNLRINGAQAYRLWDRERSEAVMDNMTLNSAYALLILCA